MDDHAGQISRNERAGRRNRAITAGLYWLALCLLLASCGSIFSQLPPSLAPNKSSPSSAVPTAQKLTPTYDPTPALPTEQPSVQPTVEPTQPASVVVPTPPLPTLLPTPVATTRPTSESLSVAEREEILDQVWQLVNDHYLYPDFGGVNWQAVREDYSRRVATTLTNDEFYADVSEMIGMLGDHHSRFVPPAAVVNEDAFVTGRETVVGIGILTVPTSDGAFIQMVFPDSPAARADLRPRDRIVAVDGHPYRVEDDDLHGVAGSQVRLSIVRPGEKVRDVVLVRQEVQGRIGPTYQRLPGEIGYVWISTLWVRDMDEQVSGALTELVAAGHLNGLILDLRGNPGGWRPVLSGILSHFVRGQVGKFYSRDRVQPLVITPPAGPDLRGIPMAVLIDQDTSSYAEVLAAILQHEAGALVVGTPSAGNTETIYSYQLTDGSRLWLAQEGFRLQNDVSLEGKGVQPDVIRNVNWKRYSEDDDPQLLEALHLLGAGPK